VTNGGDDLFGLEQLFFFVCRDDRSAHQAFELVDRNQDEAIAVDARRREDFVTVCRSVTQAQAIRFLFAPLFDNHVGFERVARTSNDAFGDGRRRLLNATRESIHDEVADVALPIIASRARRIRQVRSGLGRLAVENHDDRRSLRHCGALLEGCFGAAESNDRGQWEEKPSHSIWVRADVLNGPIFCELVFSLVARPGPSLIHLVHRYPTPMVVHRARSQGWLPFEYKKTVTVDGVGHAMEDLGPFIPDAKGPLWSAWVRWEKN
jgi:hypothetical protein